MDKKWMQYALSLAEKGSGFVSPNPMVGALLVRDDKILSEGWHQKYGGPHAEVNAFENIEADVSDCTMYVTLEPCSHYGKTPPCVDRIIKSGVKKVVVAMKDPNPLVAGQGIEKMKAAGIEVVTGVLEEEAKDLNRAFIKFITQKVPYVISKTAMTLDGKIAAYTGDSKWVTSEEARTYVHEMRHRLKGIMVGIGTVLADDPLLNVRLDKEEVSHPVRIVVDSDARIPLRSKLVQTAHEIPLILAVSENLSDEKRRLLESKGVKIIALVRRAEGLDLQSLMKALGALGIDSILLEGGGTLNWSMFKAGLVDEINAFIAPKIIGGTNAITPVEGQGFERMAQAIELDEWTSEEIGKDLLIKGSVHSREVN